MFNFLKDTYNFFLSTYNFSLFLVKEQRKIKSAEIIFFFPYYHTGGAERVHADIVHALKNKNCCVIFTHGSSTTNMRNHFKEKANIIELNSVQNKKNKRVNSYLQNRIISLINNSDQVKYVFGCNTNYFYELLPKLKRSITKLDLFHNFFAEDAREAVIINSAQFITTRIVINEVAKRDIFNFYKKNLVSENYFDNVKIIENGIKLYNNELKIKNKKQIKIGFIGRWCFEKRPELFLKIAKKVKLKYPYISFVMAGTGMKSNIELILDSGVVFVGEISNIDDLNKLYEELHFIVLPSIYEGFPMVFMESMAFGVVPLATSLDGIREHIESGFNGFLIKENDESNMINFFCEAIFEMILDADRFDEISQNCYNYAHQNFNISVFNDKYASVFEN